ncbi:hypothetical protein QTH97_33080 [Variovorax sp. J22R24]|uniref:hypothetical protein n=1 Tax=Variovorax gracilis TaxID=3053502 RepID=UPI0025762F79|nr:hypothetical protein [Variovorax sp. J22R24]MDM0109791.1 hypothetical protein [Variovorax sp. J22R24]
MADVGLIINSLNIIANAQYQGRAQSRKSLHQIAFERLQGSAQQVAAILTQNPAPNADTRENLQSQFDAMQKDVNSYCTNTDGTHDIVRAFNNASVEWELLASGR